MQTILKSLIAGAPLGREGAREAMRSIVDGGAEPAQIGALLALSSLRAPRAPELVGFAEVLRERAVCVALDREDAIDVCGTGGDGQGTFNVSTTVAFVVAAAGQPVAKHGNRSVGSRCGSFDVLESLGLSPASSPAEARRAFARYGLTFLFAPAFHPALRELAPLRRSLGFRTVFNVLGPLLNPARTRRQLVGIYDDALLEPMAEALGQLGAVEAMVVRGEDGGDEISAGGPTRVAHYRSGLLQTYTLKPQDFGFDPVPLAALTGGDARENARILRGVLAGDPGPCRVVTVINAAAALVVGGHAQSFEEGALLASFALDSGRALALLEALVAGAFAPAPEVSA